MYFRPNSNPDAAGHSPNSTVNDRDNQWHVELSDQIRFDQKVSYNFSRIHFLKLAQAIETVLTGVLTKKKELTPHAYLNVTVLDRLRIRLRRKFYDLSGSTKLTHRFTLTLSDWIVLHTCLIWDWEDLVLRSALSEIDYLVQVHCHNKVVLKKVNLLG
jgi:hypothetical protein